MLLSEREGFEEAVLFKENFGRATPPPLPPRSISTTQSSSSLSDASEARMGSPSGKTKSASGHSSLANGVDGAGIADI